MRNGFLQTLTLLFLCSCGSATFFKSPNQLQNIPGTLHLRDGKTITGNLVIDSDRPNSKAVQIYRSADKKPLRVPLSEIKGYAAQNESYELKEIKKPIVVGKGHSLLSQLAAGKSYSFLKRLTPVHSRIHLYENMEPQTAGSTTTSRYTTVYYITLPTELENAVYPLDDSRLVPNFHEKMSRHVADCPALAQKIARKEPGYTYAHLNIVNEKRLAVLLNIIEEYNACN
jgi:hypothetical protein